MVGTAVEIEVALDAAMAAMSIAAAVEVVAAVAGVIADDLQASKEADEIVPYVDEDDADPSTPVGRSGGKDKVTPGTNAPATIGGREHTGHALDRMQERGITPTVVEDTIAHGQAEPGQGVHLNTNNYYGNGIRVSTNEDGSVITVRESKK